MRQGVLGLLGATNKEMQAITSRSNPPPPNRLPTWSGSTDPLAEPPQLPTLLGSRRAAKFRALQQVKALVERPPHVPVLEGVRRDEQLPELSEHEHLGQGAYGGVYSVKGNPELVVKVFASDDWSEVVRESSFAQEMKAKDPQHFVQCFGIGHAPSNRGGKHFAIFERAPGTTLARAAHRYHSPAGIRTASQALEVLDQLSTIMIDMMTPDARGNVHFHLDLKADNIMVGRDADHIRVTLVDYGLVKTCHKTDPDVKECSRQVFRWLAWELLWLLSSEEFRFETAASRENPWEQPPEGFLPFFRPSGLRPAAYRTEQLSPKLIDTAMGDTYFDQVLSPEFRRHWAKPDEAKQKLGKLLGDMFYGVALASDHVLFEPDFLAIREEIRELKRLAKL